MVGVKRIPVEVRQAVPTAFFLPLFRAVVVQLAQALKIPEPKQVGVTTMRYDVIRDHRGSRQPCRETEGTKRFGPKLVRPSSAPRGGLVQLSIFDRFRAPIIRHRVPAGRVGSIPAEHRRTRSSE